MPASALTMLFISTVLFHAAVARPIQPPHLELLCSELRKTFWLDRVRDACAAIEESDGTWAQYRIDLTDGPRVTAGCDCNCGRDTDTDTDRQYHDSGHHFTPEELNKLGDLVESRANQGDAIDINVSDTAGYVIGSVLAIGGLAASAYKAFSTGGLGGLAGLASSANTLSTIRGIFAGPPAPAPAPAAAAPGPILVHSAPPLEANNTLALVTPRVYR